MKTLFSLSSFVVLLLVLLGTQATMTSCKKTVYVHDTTTKTITIRDTVIHTDTVAPTPPTKTQLLTAHTWQVDELYQEIANEDTTHYKRGGENTTPTNWDPVRYTFKADGSGTNVSTDKSTFTLRWKFMSSDEQTIQIILNTTEGAKTFYWSLVSISDDEFFETSASRDQLVSARLVPATN